MVKVNSAQKRRVDIIGKDESFVLPILPRRDTVLFPHTVSQLVVMRPGSVKAGEAAWASDRRIVIVSRTDINAREMKLENISSIGTEATIGRLLRMPDGTTNLWVQGQRRIRIIGLIKGESGTMARVEPVSEKIEKGLASEALKRATLTLFEKCVKLSPRLTEESYIAAINIDDNGWLADFIASSLELELPQKQDILENLDPNSRLKQVSLFLAKELEVLELQGKISTTVREELEKTQRDYYLREQMKAIQKELGEVDAVTRELNELKEKISKAQMPEQVEKKALDELQRLSSMPPASPEAPVIRTYVDWIINLPWKQETVDNLDIKKAAKILEDYHYGLKKIKERILEYMAVRKLAQGKLRSPILCFVGPPGVGKTSLGRSIAQALGRKFVRISLGGIRDEAEIRGHRRTYVGALPGRILQTMRQAGTVNPVFMMDEIDKLGQDFRGDPSSALLEVLDPEQNHSFSDHYLEVPYNLSKVLFITTANFLEPVIPALLDRMEVIELHGYIEEEKLEIAKRFLVPKQLEEHGLEKVGIRFTEGSLMHIIRDYTREAGVRNLEREIGGICRKVARVVAEDGTPPQVIAARSLEKYMGAVKYFWSLAEEKDEIGVATGVARTEMGGDLINVEVTVMEGKGNLILTGQMGEVMQESAQAGLSYARSRAKELGIKPKTFEKRDLHIHVPAGAVPKDGPSAGITMATAMISALIHAPVRKDVAMTGEITLRGMVLPIGGLKEKILAARRAGINTFILPKKNEKDLSEVPKNARNDMEFILVEHMDKVLVTALKKTDTSSQAAAAQYNSIK